MPVSLGPGPLGLFVVLVALTAVSGRLLGIRLRWWQALVAGFPGLIIGIVFVWALTGGGRAPRTLPVPAVLLAALVATMLIAVVLELLARPGRLANVQGRLAAHRIPHPVRSLKARVRRTRRYLEVTRIAGHHGLAAFTGRHRRPPPAWTRLVWEATSGGKEPRLGKVVPPPGSGDGTLPGACAPRWRREVASS